MSEQPPSDTESGNHYIMPGTWLRDRSLCSKELGVVTDILGIHESGTVKIRWYPNSISYVSAPMFRERLISGRWGIDNSRSRNPGTGR